MGNAYTAFAQDTADLFLLNFTKSSCSGYLIYLEAQKYFLTQKPRSAASGRYNLQVGALYRYVSV